MQSVLVCGTCVLYNLDEHRLSEHGATASRGNLGSGSCQPPVTTSPSADLHVTLFSVCFCLKTSHLVYIVGSFTLSSHPMAL